MLGFNGLIWPITISKKQLQIGCQLHSIEDWQNFDDATISRMEERAQEFWKVWKAPIMALCEAHRAGSVDKAEEGC